MSGGFSRYNRQRPARRRPQKLEGGPTRSLEALIMPDHTLLLLLDEVRSRTIRRLNSASPRSARWAPHRLQNTILWHAGHSYFLLEWLTMQALGKPPDIPAGWYEMFSWESLP